MIAYAPQRVIVPQRLLRLQGRLDLDRAPIRCTCECSHFDLICVPNAHGRLDWHCVDCRRHHTIGFRPEAAEWHEEWRGPIQREPIEHKCMSDPCERRDWIILPAGAGELRWDCSGTCGSTWGMRFRQDGQVDLFKVR